MSDSTQESDASETEDLCRYSEAHEYEYDPVIKQSWCVVCGVIAPKKADSA